MKKLYLTLLLALLCMSAFSQRIKVAFVGDPQVDNETELSYARKSVYAELASRKDLDLAVFLGDMVNDDVSLLGPTRAILDSLPFPWGCVPGNHDRDFYGRKKGRMLSPDGIEHKNRPRDMSTYSRVICTPDTFFVKGGVCFVMMDDVRTAGKGDYEGGFREDQKVWLRSVLEAVPKERQLVLSAHIPFSEFKALDSLEAILSLHPRTLLMCGHTHTMARHILEFPGGLRLEEVLAGAACGSWWRGVKDSHGIPSATQNCGAPRCYYLAEFTPEGYTLDYKVIGKPAKEKASAWIADSTRLVLNIYGGAVGGSVKVRLPGSLRWTEVPQKHEPAPEEYQVALFNRTIEGPRSRDPRYIPMRTVKSPHVWAVDLRSSPALKRLRPGRRIRIRYSDPSCSFKSSARLQISPGPPSHKPAK